MHCTLWDGYADRMQLFIDTHDSSQPVILILQLCKLKKFYGLYCFMLCLCFCLFACHFFVVCGVKYCYKNVFQE